MADRTLKVTLRSDDQISGTFQKVGDASQKMGDAIEDSTKRAADSTKSLTASIKDMERDLNRVGTGLTVLGAAGTVFFGAATKSSMDFTAAMSNVNSIARVSDAELSKLRSTILDLSRQTGSMPTDLADGLYDIIGSGFEAADALEILSAATVAAKAGLTDTATAATAVTAVLNAYRMSADQAGNVSDILFKVVDSGVITFEELSGSMGRTLPLAASLQVSLEELGAAYAALTVLGIGPSEAETGIAAIMTAAISPTTALTEALKEYGYESAEALIKTEGFSGFLEFLQRSAGGSTTAMGELMGNVRATNAALALATDEGRVYAEMLEDMGGAARDGAYTLEVFGIQMKNAAGAVQLMMGEIAVAQVNIGAALEPLVAGGAQGVRALVAAFNDLPGPAQAVATYIGAAGASLALFTGSAMLAVPKAVELIDAMRRIRQSDTAATFARGTIRMIGWTAAAALVATAAYKIWDAWKDGERAASTLAQSYQNLIDLHEQLILSGDRAAAAQVDWMAQSVEAFTQSQKFIYDNIETIFSDRLDEAAKVSPHYRTLVLKELWDAYSFTSDEAERFDKQIRKVNEAIALGQIDAERFNKEFMEMVTLMQTEGSGVTADDVLAWMESRNLADYAVDAKAAAAATDALNAAMQEATASASDLMAVFDKMPAMIDDLRLAGKWELADQLDELNANIVDAFSQRDFMGLGAPGGELEGFIDTMKLTSSELDVLDEAWQRSMAAMSEGVIDNTRYMREWNAILSDSTKTDAEKVAAIHELSLSTHEYRDSQKAMLESQREFLSDGERILDWWREYDRIMRAADGDGAFRGMVEWAGQIGAAGNALDQALRTFKQIDDLGSRSASAGSIAEKLVGSPGEWAEIDNMLQRWLETANGVREVDAAYERYNRTVAAGYEIQDSNVRVQQLLNDLRADQLPMLAQEQVAYEQNLQYLTTLNAEEQRRALMLQDSAVRTEIATAYNVAYAASMGEIPEEVATEMLVNTAQADPALAGILVQMGLLNEEIGPDGVKTFSVNFPDADATVSSINRLTIAFLEMEAAARGMSGFQLAVELYGEKEAMEVYGMVKEADGTYSKATLNVETEGADQVTAASEALKEVTLADGTIVQVKTEVDTSGWDNLTAAQLADKFGNDPVQLPVEAVLKPMDGVTDAEWNDMIGPFPEVTVPVKLEAEPFDPTTLGPIQGPTLQPQPVAAGVTIEATDNATPVIQEAYDLAEQGAESRIEITGENEGAVAAVEVIKAYDGQTIATAVLDISGNTEGAMAAVDVVSAYDAVSLGTAYLYAVGDDSSAANMISHYNARDGEHLASAYVYAIGDGTSAGNMLDYFSQFDGTTLATTYVNVVARSVSPLPFAHGGVIPEYAGGGTVFRAGERGAEIARFSNGGTALLPYDGYYMAPAGTYISPHNAVGETSYGGVNVDFSGAVFNGTTRADMDAWATETLIPQITEAIENRRRGYGGVA